jgi:prevent-host-death family protein
MRTIPAGSFKANCLSLMDEVNAKGATLLITKRGKPVAKLVPATETVDDIFGFMLGKGTITGDVVGPVISPDEWNSSDDLA